MPLLTFNSFCGCIDLRNGCFIIAYFYLVANIVQLTLMGTGMFALTNHILEIEDKDEEMAKLAVLLITSIMLVLALIMLSFVITLLVGLHKHKRGAVKAFLVGLAIYSILDFITFCLTAAYDHSAGTLVTRIVALLLECYCFLIIRSYFILKMEQSGKRAIINTA